MYCCYKYLKDTTPFSACYANLCLKCSAINAMKVLKHAIL